MQWGLRSLPQSLVQPSSGQYASSGTHPRLSARARKPRGKQFRESHTRSARFCHNHTTYFSWEITLRKCKWTCCNFVEEMMKDNLLWHMTIERPWVMRTRAARHRVLVLGIGMRRRLLLSCLLSFSSCSDFSTFNIQCGLVPLYRGTHFLNITSKLLLHLLW